MDRIGAYEAKTHLPELLERTVRGEQFLITKHGVPVAVLGPAPARAALDPEAAVRALKEFRRGRTLGELSLGDLVQAGRR